MTPEQRLYETIEANERRQHPNYPDHLSVPVKRYKLNTANGLTQAVIKFIKSHGYQAERISTTGRPVDNRKTFTDSVGFSRTIGSIDWIPGTGTTGSADISATIPLKSSNGFGVSCKFEIKAGKDRISPEQIKYGEMVRSAGGVYEVIRTVADFFEWWDNNVKQ